MFQGQGMGIQEPPKPPQEIIPGKSRKPLEFTQKIFGGGQFGQVGQIGQVSGPSLEEALSQRGFKMPEKTWRVQPSISVMYKDPITGKMKSGGPFDADYAKSMGDFYAKNPEALNIAKQHQKSQQYKPVGFGDLHQGPPKPPQEIMPSNPAQRYTLQPDIPQELGGFATQPPDKYGRKFSGQQYGKDVFRNTPESFKLMAKEAGFSDMPVEFGGGHDSRDMVIATDPVTGKRWGGGSVGLNRRRKLAKYFEKTPGAKEWWQSNFGEKAPPEGWGGPDQGLYQGGLGEMLTQELDTSTAPTPIEPALVTPTVAAPVPPPPIADPVSPPPLDVEEEIDIPDLSGISTTQPEQPEPFSNPSQKSPVFGGGMGGGIGGLQQFMQIMQMIMQMVQQSQGRGMGGMGMGGMRRNNFSQPQGFGGFNQYQSRQQYNPQFQQNFGSPYGPY